MTGFARCNKTFIYENKKYTWAWEVKSVNAKGQDIKLRLPFWLEDISENIKSVFSETFSRGTFNICLDIELENDNPDIEINTKLLDVLSVKLKQIYQSDTNLYTKPSPAELLRIGGVVKVVDNTPDEQELKTLKNELLDSVKEVASLLKQDRIKEGQKIAVALKNILSDIKTTVEKAENIAIGMPQKLKEKVSTQVENLLSDTTIAPERLEQEIVFLVMKADVKEEIDRLYAHIKTAFELLESNTPIGRRLDFLCQELNREANTLCSKSCDIEQTKYGMELKALIEQFREQTQNME